MQEFRKQMALVVGLGCLSDLAAASENWEFMVEPYMLATSIGGDAAIGRVGEVDVDVDFDTILDNLDAALLVHAEAVHNSGWGIWFDYGLMDLKGDTRTVRDGRLDVRVKQAVTELAAIYRIPLDPNGESWDIIFGARHWENELRLKVAPPAGPVDQFTLRTEPGWTDAFVGGRYRTPLNEDWSFYVYGDIGAGEADFTGAARLGVEYAFNNTWEIDLAYKGLWVDYEEGRQRQAGHFIYDTLTHGPIVGLKIHF